MTLLCVSANDRPLIGDHEEGCDSASCRGCARQPARDGLQVCKGCATRTSDNLAALPRLYNDLLQPTRAGSPGASWEPEDAERSEATSIAQHPLLVSGDAITLRSAIKVALVGWCVILEEDFHISPPADDMLSICAHLLRLAPRWLLASEEHAARFADELDDLAKQAGRRAYPSAPQGHKIGDCPLIDPQDDTRPCGGPVRAILDNPDGDGWARCQRCQTSAVVEYWEGIMPAEYPDWMGMSDLRWHLSVVHHQLVSEGTIKSWSHRGQLHTRRKDEITPPLVKPWPRTTYQRAAAVELAKARAMRGRTSA